MEQNILTIFENNFEMNVHFIEKRGKSISEIHFCEGLNPLVTFKSQSSNDFNSLKT